MNDFASLLQQGNAWLFIPSAILLGALHGLEPGHSKTMMAAFIVAVRGTLKQAVLLGLAATVSHTAVVWLVAMAGLWFGRGWNAQTSEPWFQLISGGLIVLIACWMLARTWRESRSHIHGHEHDHDHKLNMNMNMNIITIATLRINIILTLTNLRGLPPMTGRTPTSARMRKRSIAALTASGSPPGRSSCSD